LSNAVTLPHIGSATNETREAMANRALANLRSALLGERPQDSGQPASLARIKKHGQVQL
jgi:gluconate 2-dehydrogenase